jgi:hypothetical protein
MPHDRQMVVMRFLEVTYDVKVATTAFDPEVTRSLQRGQESNDEQTGVVRLRSRDIEPEGRP